MLRLDEVDELYVNEKRVKGELTAKEFGDVTATLSKPSENQDIWVIRQRAATLESRQPSEPVKPMTKDLIPVPQPGLNFTSSSAQLLH